MSKPMTEEELAQFEALTNKAWQETVDNYLKDFPSTEMECRELFLFAMGAKLNGAAELLAVAMMKIHDAIQHQTGEGLQVSDLFRKE